MKFEKTRIIKDGSTVFAFAVGEKELELLYDSMLKTWMYFPNIFELQPIKHRLACMKNAMKVVLDNEKADKKRRLTPSLS